ncbi:capsular biosynthesis protein [Paraburkholderia sp. Tr-20389]|uniref:capsular polysaccharide export protein, LipB/KpsS family n=1 Tax=Paraburkholderia sp. Tr-20389 TaxID=2703903 RepID=UPI00197D4912|nr:capsular biosynthesis protein [Paraburkholderia sp. Tr-20389]MBN3756907.1 capsular biosynthesis protein [Paraburkholderia sp. Tr-20389]
MTIAVVVDSLERFYFIRRLVKPIEDECDFVFITSEPLAHLLLRLEGHRSVYLRRDVGIRQVSTYDASAFERSIEVLNGQIDVSVARVDSMATFAAVSELFSDGTIERCVMWNGQQLVCRVVSQACAKYGVRTRFLELSNLPGKLFVDDSGVNALSTIAKNPTIIDGYPLPDRADHNRWIEEYEEYKRQPLPQSRTLIRRKSLSLLNYALKFLTCGVGRKRLDRTRASNGARLPSLITEIDVKELISRRYIFLPLQVSGDTQIRLHSDVNNLQAILIALKLAKEEGLDLIVKIHPAENDRSQIDEIVHLQKIHNFRIACTATVDLVRYASVVVTINSTVGLEAMLYERRVVALGRCLYKEFDHDRLMKYIHGFLVDGIDYFGTDPIDGWAARRTFSIGGDV